MFKAIRIALRCSTIYPLIAISKTQMDTDLTFVHNYYHGYECHHILYELVICVHMPSITFVKVKNMSSTDSRY